MPNPLPGQADEIAGRDGAPPASPFENGKQPAAPSADPNVSADGQNTTANDAVGGMSALRGLMLYGAILVFAGLYIDFVVVISTSARGHKPTIDATLISAAAALSGVLGSAFALKIGVSPHPSLVNSELATHTANAKANRASPIAASIRRALSLEPSDVNAKSWPLTFGIWTYGAVASAVLGVYILNQNETPSAVKAIAVTFGGYVVALINTAYGMAKQSGV